MQPTTVTVAYETANGIVNERIERVRRRHEFDRLLQASRALLEFRRSVRKGLSRGLKADDLSTELHTTLRTSVQT